jgi:plastocyanin domain-containing protein
MNRQIDAQNKEKRAQKTMITSNALQLIGFLRFQLVLKPNNPQNNHYRKHKLNNL